jgi:hypothetical protein
MGPMTGGARGWCNPAGAANAGYGAYGNPWTYSAGYSSPYAGSGYGGYASGWGMPMGGYGVMPGMGMAWGRGRAPFGYGRGMAWGGGFGRGFGMGRGFGRGGFGRGFGRMW